METKETKETKETTAKPKAKAAAPKKEKPAAEPVIDNAELDALKAELEKQKDLLLRTAAEFDNFKKRTEREKAVTAQYAKASLIKTLLPVIDNAHRANESDYESPDFAKGAQLIIKQLLDSVSAMGIEETAKEGDPFDPEFHEAVMHIEDQNQPENTVVEVLQKGYKLNDTVLRAAMVKVAN